MTLAAVRWSRRLLSVAFFAFAVTVLGVGLGARIGPALGWEVFAIRSGSMAPAVPVGALSIVERQAKAPARGEVAAFRTANGVVVTHRVTEVIPMEGGTFLRTKGDANRTADPSLVPVSTVIGTVRLSVPLLGYLLAMLGMPSGLVCIFSVAGTLIATIWLLEDLEYTAERDGRVGSATRPAVGRSLEA